MKPFILISFFLITKLTLAQDTAVTWITNVDTTKYKMLYKKRSIPKNFYSIIGIEDLSDIVSANKPYRQGCLGGLPGQRLNWLAKDAKGHWVLSISFGGRAHGTKYIFIDNEKSVLNINGFYFLGANKRDLSLGSTIQKIKAREYRRMDRYFFE